MGGAALPSRAAAPVPPSGSAAAPAHGAAPAGIFRDKEVGPERAPLLDLRLLMRPGLPLCLGALLLLCAPAASAAETRLTIKNRRIEPRQTLATALQEAALTPAEVSA